MSQKPPQKELSRYCVMRYFCYIGFMSTSRPAKSTGYLGQIDVKYQVEGITAAQAARIQAAIAAAIEDRLPSLITSALVDHAPRAYADQITHRSVVAHNVEEYDA